MRKTLIAGNWKMHKTLAEGRELVVAIRKGVSSGTAAGVLVCPPFPLLHPLREILAGSGIMLGAQNCHEEAHGAFTGEVSVPMLVDAGCSHVIIGHSERRHVFGEPGDRLRKKVRATVTAGLTAVYCVGETIEQRDAGQTHDVVGRQLDEALDREIPPGRLVVAYEPVWAIGTGRNATPDQAQDVHAFIRSRLGSLFSRAAADEITILYGGSVKPGNAADLLRQPDIDGALVGGACLVADDFLAIIRAAS